MIKPYYRDNKFISVKFLKDHRVPIVDFTKYPLKGYFCESIEEAEVYQNENRAAESLKRIDMQKDLFIGENSSSKYFYLMDCHIEYRPYNLEDPFVRSFLLHKTITFYDWSMSGWREETSTILGFKQTRHKGYKVSIGNIRNLSSEELKEYYYFYNTEESVAEGYFEYD